MTAKMTSTSTNTTANIASLSTLAPSSISASSYNSSTDKLLFIFVTAFIILVIGWIWQVFSTGKYPTGDTDVTDDDNVDIHTIRSTVALSSTNTTVFLRLRMSLEFYIQLYKKTFDANGNQTTLTENHIIVTQKMMNNTREGEDVEENEKNTNHIIESIIDVELGDNNVSKDDDDDDDDEDDDDDPATQLSVESDLDTTTSTRTTSVCFDSNEDRQQQQMINEGTCIICFEDFVTDDRIVWSHNPKCTHVYHQDCMVQYLASNAQRKETETLDITHNPCPTCRRPNYCGPVRGEDVFQVLVASIQQQKNNSSNNNNSAEENDNSTEGVLTTLPISTSTVYPIMALATATAADTTPAEVTEAVVSTTTIGNTVASTSTNIDTNTDTDTDTDTDTFSDTTNTETATNTALATVTTTTTTTAIDTEV